MNLHLEILSMEQREVLPRLGEFAGQRGFFLGGGTAVALYFGHRRSIDFDWFTSAAMGDPLVLAKNARMSGLRVENAQIAPGTLHALIQGVRVSFFEYPYPQISAPVFCEQHAFSLASLDDLACMKLAAVAQRGSRKDFVDLYYIARNHKSISETIPLYRQKYGTDDITPVLVGLSYFDDADNEPQPAMLENVEWDEIKKQFKRWVGEIAGC